jgi:hypothetical protein
VSSFSALSNLSRAANHSFRVPVLCFVIPLSLQAIASKATSSFEGWGFALESFAIP